MESLEELAVIDDVTGLRNQRALWRELRRRLGVCSESSPLALVMVDFDLFKAINEGYGHAVGDAVLRRGASVLRAAAPSPRLAFRYGGEEFVLLMPGDEADGRELAERVRSQIARQNGALPAVTVSCGVAALDGPVEPWVALDRADAALREAKRGGRNRVAVASSSNGSGAGSYLVEELEHETARRAAMALAVATLEVRDANTADHSDDVLTLCESVGRELGFAGHELERLMAGAQLHDVGKVAVPSEILNKPGPLNETEWAVIREHTVIGERILRSVPEMAEVATIVRHSHEHWDGSGYPDGLAAERIPLASRVILCADAFHAIRSDRPYRSGRSAADAFDEIRRSAGTQFDPRVVDALQRVADEIRTRGAGRFSQQRRKRLVALLATLAIGSGSAVAAIPELRDAVRSLIGVTGPPTEVLDEAGVPSFSFGPLGDLLSIAPTRAQRGADGPAVVPRSIATRQPGGRAGGPAAEIQGVFDAPDSSRERLRAPANGGDRGTTPRGVAPPAGAPSTPGSRSTPGTGPSGGGGTPGGTGTGGAPGTDTGNGTAPAPSDPVAKPPAADGDGEGNGRGLGKILPTPRNPAVPPSQKENSGTPGRPDAPGRPDPPAIGLESGPAAPAPKENGKAGGSATP